uniref:Uncharacterized protein n=1 Tax=viral metagenome TaxID=1070528 RepID=A0A6C0KEP9_9ZZZZ
MSNLDNSEYESAEQADELWRVFFNQFSDDYVLHSVHSFFQNVEGMEAFFYYIMAKRVLVDNILQITEQYIHTMRAVQIIPHIVDGWEDFFLKTDYTLSPQLPNHEELERYRLKVYQVLIFLIPYLGESWSELNLYYRSCLKDYFLIRVDTT